MLSLVSRVIPALVEFSTRPVQAVESNPAAAIEAVFKLDQVALPHGLRNSLKLMPFEIALLCDISFLFKNLCKYNFITESTNEWWKLSMF